MSANSGFSPVEGLSAERRSLNSSSVSLVSMILEARAKYDLLVDGLGFRGIGQLHEKCPGHPQLKQSIFARLEDPAVAMVDEDGRGGRAEMLDLTLDLNLVVRLLLERLAGLKARASADSKSLTLESLKGCPD